MLDLFGRALRNQWTLSSNIQKSILTRFAIKSYRKYSNKKVQTAPIFEAGVRGFSQHENFTFHFIILTLKKTKFQKKYCTP